MEKSRTKDGLKMKVVIIGGVAGGMSAATRLRRLREDAEIIVYEKGPYVSFANCGLPYFIGGVIDKKESLLLQTPQSLWNRFRLDVRVNTEVTAIDRENKTITAVNSETGEQQEDYDYIIVSPGANPRKLPIEGIERAVVLKDVEDSVRIKEMVDAGEIKSAAILGAGFIGVELAENLVHRGVKTTMVEFRDHVLPQFDIEMIEPFQAHLNENGVEIAVSAETQSIGENSLTLKDGRVIDADLVVSSVGVVADSKLAELAGLEMGNAGGIKVDDYLRTSDPNIFAVGDAVEKQSLITDQQQMIWLANLANRHGRLVADVIAGETAPARKSIGTGIIGAFGMAAALTGITEGLAQRMGIDYKAIHLHPGSHAGYFPGSERISLKVIFDPESGKLLGAQSVGKDGADKRIDIIATAIYAGLTVDDLMNLELAYSPQFGSAKDAINHAGYVGNNVLENKSPNVHWNQLDSELTRGVKILDVRTKAEFDRGHIPGAILAPVDELRDKLDELAGEEYVVHCAVGQRAHTAIQILKSKGIKASNLSGGYTTWKFAQDALARNEI
jgi:NADPH-dependent 2,4-dienoyl-CoA reductase/sulfur reductase-like enzyme/rhodanese-related sulfurtransferase